jgi:hypothetical protein
MKCPRCGYDPSRDPDWRQWQRRDYRNYNLAESLPAGSEYERRKANRQANPASDVIVPVAQAVITALVAGLTGGVLSAILDVWRPLPSAGVCFVGGLALAWLSLLQSHRALLWDVERIVGADSNGHVGPIEVLPDVTRVEITERRRNQTQVRYVDVPLSDSELRRLAQALLERDLTFSRRSLSESNVVSTEQYAELTDAMLSGGLLRLRGDGKRAGVTLTGAGRAFLRQYLG